MKLWLKQIQRVLCKNNPVQIVGTLRTYFRLTISHIYTSFYPQVSSTKLRGIIIFYSRHAICKIHYT